MIVVIKFSYLLEYPVRLKVLAFQEGSENLIDNPLYQGTGQSAGKTLNI